MPLPADFPPSPKRPPATQPVTDAAGRITQPWATYLDAADRFAAAVRKRLEEL